MMKVDGLEALVSILLVWVEEVSEAVPVWYHNVCGVPIDWMKIKTRLAPVKAVFRLSIKKRVGVLADGWSIYKVSMLPVVVDALEKTVPRITNHLRAVVSKVRDVLPWFVFENDRILAGSGRLVPGTTHVFDGLDNEIIHEELLFTTNI
jgi:hypothetical protein